MTIKKLIIISVIFGFCLPGLSLAQTQPISPPETLEEAKEKGAKLKTLFNKKGGEYTVYVQIGKQTIKFLYITFDEDLKNNLEELVGIDRIQFQN